MNFFVKIAKKEGIFVHRASTDDVAGLPDVASRTQVAADVARGTTAPLRRGTEATWQDACGPRRRRTGRAKWQGGHVSARVGCHV